MANTTTAFIPPRGNVNGPASSTIGNLATWADTTGTLLADGGPSPVFPSGPYTIGDLLYASSTTALSRLADVAVGSVLVSGGVGVAPAWSANPSVTSIRVGNGTAAAPSVAPASAPSFGFWFSSGYPVVSTNGFGRWITTNAGIQLRSDGAVSWGSGAPESSSGDLFMFRDALNTLAQRNGTNAQAFRLYNTYTDAGNYERLGLGWISNVFTISSEALGTGTVRPIMVDTGTAPSGFIVRSGGSDRWQFNSSGHFLAVTDNAYDIGASGATRPRTGYFGTSVIAPTVRANTEFNINGTTGATAGPFTAITSITVVGGIVTAITGT